MCLAPVLIDNPNYRTPVSDPLLNSIWNTTDTKIAVPCGRCPVCIHLRQIYIVQRVQMESLDNDLFYGTLTYNQESLPRSEFGEFSFAHVDISDWQKMLKRIRSDFPDLKFKYLVVSEYGSKKHRPHFHFILSVPRVGKPTLAERHSQAQFLFDTFLQYWQRNVAPKVWSPKRHKWITDSRNPQWQPLLTYRRVKTRQGWNYNYDLHYLDPNSSNDGLDGVSFYVTKYILKYDDWIEKFKSKLYYNLDLDSYKDAWSLLRPRILMSKGFGSPYSPSVQDHICKGINIALSDSQAFYPYYFSRVSGQSFPLSPYYQKKFITPAIQSVFVSRRPDLMDDVDESLKKFDNFKNVKDFLSHQVYDFDYDSIDDINSHYFNINEDGKFSQTAEDFAESSADW